MSLTGNLEDLGIGEILQILFLSRRSGVLSISAPSREGRIYFHKGMVVSATSTDLSGNLVDLLVEKGISGEDLQERLEEISRTSEDREGFYRRISKILDIPLQRLEDWMKERIEEIVFDLFLEEGTFSFELAGEIEIEDPLQILYLPGLNPQFLAMEGTRLLDERRRDAGKVRKEEAPKPRPDFRPSRPAKKEEARSTPGLSLLKSMLYELQNPHTNAEITLLILRFASEIMNRAVLFMVKKDRLIGLGQFGVKVKGKDPNMVIREIEIPLTEASIFKEAIDFKVAIKKRPLNLPVNERFLDAIGGGRPVEAFVAPIMVNQKVAALLYGDNLPEEKPIGDTEGLEIFLFQAGMAMERALLERKLSSRE